MNRFHAKNHGNTHHTDKTEGYPESATDPIASQSHPFNGDLSISGDLNIGGDLYIASGGLDISAGGNIINSYATSAESGVIRIATSVEATANDNRSIAVCPASISNLVAGGSHPLNGTLHTDVQITTPAIGDYLIYSDLKWKNQPIPSGISVALATSQEAKTINNNGVAVTPKQMFDQIEACRPSWGELPSGKAVGAMAFIPYTSSNTYGFGNSGLSYTWYGLKVYYYDGVSWIPLRG